MNKVLKIFILLLPLCFLTGFQIGDTQVEKYFKLNNLNYPIHFDLDSSIKFDTCGDIVDSLDYYIDKFADKKRLIENSNKYKEQVVEYFKNSKVYNNDKAVIINRPSLCLWDTLGTIYYGVTYSNYYYSIAKTPPCEHCIKVDEEKGIWKASYRVIFEIINYDKVKYKFIWE